MAMVATQKRQRIESERAVEILSTDEELEIADALLNMPYLIFKSISFCRFPYSWGSKRRRSALDSPPPAEAIEVAAKTEASSPATPLSFSPSEYDGKSKHSSKRKNKFSVKSTREELMKIINERTETQQVLKEGIEKVRCHLSKLKAVNLELKAKRQELSLNWGLKRENHELEACQRSESTQQKQHRAVNDQVHAAPPTPTEFHHPLPFVPHHQQGLIIHQTVLGEVEFGGQFTYHQPKLVGPLILDLNVSAEEMVAVEHLQPLDQGMMVFGIGSGSGSNVMMSSSSGAYAAQARVARQNRIQINKMKKPPRGRL